MMLQTLKTNKQTKKFKTYSGIGGPWFAIIALSKFPVFVNDSFIPSKTPNPFVLATTVATRKKPEKNGRPDQMSNLGRKRPLEDPPSGKQAQLQKLQKRLKTHLDQLNEAPEDKLKREEIEKEEETKTNVEFYRKITSDQFPTIPDSVVQYFLRKAGCNCPDERVIRLVGLAAKRFAYGVIDGSMDHFDWELNNGKKSNTKKLNKNKKVLHMKQLVESLSDQGIRVVKPPFYNKYKEVEED